VIARVESGASRREAAEYYDINASPAVIWVKCFRVTGRCSAKPRGGSTPRLEAHPDRSSREAIFPKEMWHYGYCGMTRGLLLTLWNRNLLGGFQPPFC
jgi:transposase